MRGSAPDLLDRWRQCVKRLETIMKRSAHSHESLWISLLKLSVVLARLSYTIVCTSVCGDVKKMLTREHVQHVQNMETR